MKKRLYKVIIFGVMGIMQGVLGVSESSAAETPIVQVSNLKYSYEQMQQDITALKERYPEQIQVNSLGTTADGRDVTEIILGDVNAEHHILIQATMHAREYMNTVLAMNQIEDYLRDSETRSYEGQTWKEIFRNVCLHIVPMVNPDGVTVSQDGIDGISDERLKSLLKQCYQTDLADGKGNSDMTQYFRTWKANAEGVDLNRNFGAGWETYTGSSGPSTEGYKGTSSGCEPESKAILSVADKYDLDCCIAYHSFGNLIYWNYGSQGDILNADQMLAQCVSDVTGYEMHSTVQDSTDAAGCSDYFVLNLGIPAVTIENGGSECPMSIEEYQPMYERNQELWAAVACLYNR